MSRYWIFDMMAKCWNCRKAYPIFRFSIEDQSACPECVVRLKMIRDRRQTEEFRRESAA